MTLLAVIISSLLNFPNLDWNGLQSNGWGDRTLDEVKKCKPPEDVNAVEIIELFQLAECYFLEGNIKKYYTYYVLGNLRYQCLSKFLAHPHRAEERLVLDELDVWQKRCAGYNGEDGILHELSASDYQFLLKLYELRPSWIQDVKGLETVYPNFSFKSVEEQGSINEDLQDSANRFYEFMKEFKDRFVTDSEEEKE